MNTSEIRNTFSENKIYKTTNYHLFKEMEGNRPKNPQHIDRIFHSIKKNGMLINPVLVNEKFEIIDGQHRFEAAVKADKPVYTQFVYGYDLAEVHALNLNQKNWTSKDYLYGYAEMGLTDYIILKEFYEEYKVFNLSDCMAMCSNVTTGSHFHMSEHFRKGSNNSSAKHIFNEGTWKVRNMEKAHEYAKKLLEIGKYFEGYNKSGFVGTMIGMFNNPKFKFKEFINKLSKRPGALTVAPRRGQYKVMVEEIYNYRRKDKVNLRF